MRPDRRAALAPYVSCRPALEGRATPGERARAAGAAAIARCRALVAAAATLFAAMLAGCAVQTPRLLSAPPEGLPRQVELAETPFFPQEAFQCGPAALATALSAAGLATRPEDLTGQVFLPGREGSLQLEMLAGARRHGAVATKIPGTLEAVMRETAAGHPVVVLQNLGLSWAPAWHYAVVIGYDVDAATFLLRSSPIRRDELAFRTFEHTWDRAERWAFVALPPGKLPVTAEEADATSAMVAFERTAPPAAAARGYRAALERWPGSLTLAMGLGNALYAAGDRQGAEKAFGEAAARHDAAAAYNNHAWVLHELGRNAEARAAARRAVHLGGPLQEQALATLRAVEESKVGGKGERRSPR